MVSTGCRRDALRAGKWPAVREAASAFDDRDNLKDERSATLLRTVVRRLIEVARMLT